MPDDIAVFEESIFTTIGIAAYTALKYHDDNNMDDASAIINEWTNDKGECLLTYWFDDKLDEVSEDLFWCNDKEGPQFDYGTVCFQRID